MYYTYLYNGLLPHFACENSPQSDVTLNMFKYFDFNSVVHIDYPLINYYDEEY